MSKDAWERIGEDDELKRARQRLSARDLLNVLAKGGFIIVPVPNTPTPQGRAG